MELPDIGKDLPVVQKTVIKHNVKGEQEEELNGDIETNRCEEPATVATEFETEVYLHFSLPPSCLCHKTVRCFFLIVNNYIISDWKYNIVIKIYVKEPFKIKCFLSQFPI